MKKICRHCLLFGVDEMIPEDYVTSLPLAITF